MVRRRPASVTVMAILSWLFGGFTLLTSSCCGGSSLFASMVLGRSQGSGEFPGPHEPMLFFQAVDRLVPGYTVVCVLSVAVELLFGFALVACGFGLLALQRWARWASVAVAILLAVWQLLSVVYQIAFVNSAVEQVRLNSSVMMVPAGYFGYPHGAQSLFRVFLLLVAGGFCLAQVLVMFLPRVAAAFAAPPFEPPGEARVRSGEL